MNSLEKAIIVLDAIRQSDRGLSLKSISQRTGLNISTVQRCTFTLVELGYLVRDEEAGSRFRMGTRFLNFSFSALRQDPVVRIATEHVTEAQTNCVYPIWFSLRDGNELLYILRLREKSYMNALFTGRRAPLFSTAGGRAVLAMLPDDEVRSILAKTEKTPKTAFTKVDDDGILEAVRQTRRLGYSLAWQETILGEVVAGAAITNSRKEPIGAIHVSASIDEFDLDAAGRTLSPIAVNIARSISRSIREYSL